MSDNEKLIEEARAFADRDNGLNWQGRIRELADALEAAEKAHTPTDDERDAHRRVIDLWFANWRTIGKVSPAMEVAIDSLEGMVSDALDAGFRRSEVPEPSARFVPWSLSGDSVASTSANVPPTAQGEPSDELPLWERPEVVEAARLAYQEAFEANYDAEDCITAALRAAGGVR